MSYEEREPFRRVTTTNTMDHDLDYNMTVLIKMEMANGGFPADSEYPDKDHKTIGLLP